MKLYYFFFILFFTLGKFEKAFSQEKAVFKMENFVIYLNYEFPFYEEIKFIKFQQGLEIGNLRGTYRLGEIEFDKNEYEDFLQLNHDSLIAHIHVINYRDEKGRHIGIADYYFYFNQIFFNSKGIVIIIEDMIFKRARKSLKTRCKEGYALTYEFKTLKFFKTYNIPCFKK